MNVYFDKTNQRTFGTWPLRGKELTSALEIAIDIGYRSVDTAQMYGNEADIGASLTDLGLSRDELCITTKVHPDNFDDADFMPSVEKSLEKLRLDCVDVLLLHWPPIGEDIAPPLRLLEKAYEKGFARNIGVSNYTAKMMHDAKKLSMHRWSPTRWSSIPYSTKTSFLLHQVKPKYHFLPIPRSLKVRCLRIQYLTKSAPVTAKLLAKLCFAGFCKRVFQ